MSLWRISSRALPVAAVVALAPAAAVADTAPVLAQVSNAAWLGGTYSQAVQTTGVPAPTFGVTSGSLPGGLSLDPHTGVISGSILATDSLGEYDFTVSAANDAGTGSRAEQIYVAASAPPAPIMGADAWACAAPGDWTEEDSGSTEESSSTSDLVSTVTQVEPNAQATAVEVIGRVISATGTTVVYDQTQGGATPTQTTALEQSASAADLSAAPSASVAAPVAGPVTTSTSAPVITDGTPTATGNASVVVTDIFGPWILPVGTDQQCLLYVEPGQLDINTNLETDYTQTNTSQATTTTTTVYYVDATVSAATNPTASASAGSPASTGSPTTANQPAAVTLITSTAQLNTNTYFDFDKALLKPAGKKALRSILTSLAGSTKIVITGYAEPGKTKKQRAFTKTLARARARAVAKYLYPHGAPHGTQLQIVGGGGTLKFGTGRQIAKNRVVLIQYVHPSS